MTYKMGGVEKANGNYHLDLKTWCIGLRLKCVVGAQVREEARKKGYGKASSWCLGGDDLGFRGLGFRVWGSGVNMFKGFRVEGSRGLGGNRV